MVYAPDGGSFTVNLSVMPGARTLAVEWFNPSTGAVIAGKQIPSSSSSQVFTPPFSGRVDTDQRVDLGALQVDAVRHVEAYHRATMRMTSGVSLYNMPQFTTAGTLLRSPQESVQSRAWCKHLGGSPLTKSWERIGEP
jgi:hypothetical protein